MGRELAEQFTSARSVFEEADSALGFALSKLCFEGPAE
jgi:[acyl-carrier-protein] S-malonyltransferase